LGHRHASSEGAAIVREIQALHMEGNGWDDLGYNLLVGPGGCVYEGRAGGPGRGVVGAHARGFNARSCGIAVIGDFSHRAPRDAALEALAGLLAWKLSLHGLPACAETIVGHRAIEETRCPGSAFLGRLPELRQRVVARLDAGEHGSRGPEVHATGVVD
jgi:hypothetical protein